MANSVCVISTAAPYQGCGAKEALDVALVAATYDVDTAYLLMGQGVLQLLAGQEGAAVEQKTFSANLQALPLYGIETLHVEAASLQQYGLTEADVLPGVTVVHDVAVFLQQYQQVVRF